MDSHGNIQGGGDIHRYLRLSGADNNKLAFRAKPFDRTTVYEPSNWCGLFTARGRPIPIMPLALSIAWSTAVIITTEHLDEEQYWRVPWEYVGIYASTLVFLLAFRLNVANSRWWEARCLWGAQIARCWQLISTMIVCCNGELCCGLRRALTCVSLHFRL